MKENCQIYHYSCLEKYCRLVISADKSIIQKLSEKGGGNYIYCICKQLYLPVNVYTFS